MVSENVLIIIIPICLGVFTPTGVILGIIICMLRRKRGLTNLKQKDDFPTPIQTVSSEICESDVDISIICEGPLEGNFPKKTSSQQLLTFSTDAERIEEHEVRKEEIPKKISKSVRPSPAKIDENIQETPSTERVPKGSNCQSLMSSKEEKENVNRNRCSKFSNSPDQNGFAIIIQFTKDRKGTEVDSKNIKRFFESRLDFIFHETTEKTTEELRNFLNNMSDLISENAERYHSLFVFVMAHGSEGIIKTADKYIAIDEIVSYFKNDRVPSFSNKPKCFFVQACRGSTFQSGVSHDSFPQNTDADKTDAFPETVEKIEIPVDANLLVVYATTPGFAASRDEKMGTWFYCDLIQVFETYYRKKHLEEIMINLKRKVAERTRDDGRKQMACTWSTLTRQVYLEKLHEYDRK